MIRKQRYRKKATSVITAVRLTLDTPGFHYQKWGGEQHCKSGDWIVDNGSDCYTIDAESFDQTYTLISPGVYLKNQDVWAKQAAVAGTVVTKEGSTEYLAGDYLVSNNLDGSDDYAVSKAYFEASYEAITETE